MKKPDNTQVQNTYLKNCLGKKVTFVLMNEDDLVAKLRQVDSYTLIIELLDADGEDTGVYNLLYKHGILSVRCDEINVREIITEILEARKAVSYKASDERTELNRKKLTSPSNPFNRDKPTQYSTYKPQSTPTQVIVKPKRTYEKPE